MVATGYYVTAARSQASNGQSLLDPSDPIANLFSAAGTSFAAPLVAASAAIVRQYLLEGYYPTGVAGGSPPPTFIPASLVKAMLINGAEPLTGYTPFDGTRVRLSSFFSPYQEATYTDGFGRLSLERTLAFADSSFGLLIPDITASDAVSNGQVQAFCYQAPVGVVGNVSITLAWTDVPASPASLIQLVNDLDLVVFSGSSGYLGNRNVEVSPDRRNNVERVRFTLQPGASIRVQVVGARVPFGPQDYSLVISAPRGVAIAPDCVECAPGAKAACFVSHGVGEAKCNKDGHWDKCYPQTCEVRAFVRFFFLVLIRYLERLHSVVMDEQLPSVRRFLPRQRDWRRHLNPPSRYHLLACDLLLRAPAAKARKGLHRA